MILNSHLPHQKEVKSLTSGKLKIQEIKKRISYILPVLLTAVFLFFAFRNVDLAKSFDLISQANLLWMLLFLGIFYFSHFIRAVRWKVMISTVKPNASVLNLFGTVMIGYGINCAVPRLGEVYRAMFLGKWENLSRTSLLGTIIIERLIDVFSFAVSVLISVLVFPGNLFREFTWLESTIYLSFGALIIVIAFILMVVYKREKFYLYIINFFSRISPKIAGKLAYVFEMLAEGFGSLKGTRNYINAFLLTALMMLVYAASNYVAFFMLHMDSIQTVSFGMAWILMTISSFGVAIPTPGGTGSYHAFVIIVLVNLFNFSHEISAAYALLTHFITYIAFIVSTFLFIYIINKRRALRGEKTENLFTVFKDKQESE